MSAADETSILSAGELPALGVPTTIATGLPVPVESPAPVTDTGPALGLVRPLANPPMPDAPPPDPAHHALSSLPPPDPIADAAADAEAERKRKLAESMAAAALAAGAPFPARTVIVPGAPAGGRDVEFDGDPDEPVLPATPVLYWRADGLWAGWLVPCPAVVIEPVYGERKPGDPGSMALTGAYRLQRFGRAMQAMLPVSAARPSPVPRDGYFTPLRQYPPEACRVKIGG